MLSSPSYQSSSYLISSMIVSGQNQRCVEFFYQMSGSEIGTLEIHTKDSENNEVIIWQRIGYQGKDWNRAFLTIDTDTFQVMFVVTGTGGARKDTEANALFNHCA